MVTRKTGSKSAFIVPSPKRTDTEGHQWEGSLPSIDFPNELLQKQTVEMNESVTN